MSVISTPSGMFTPAPYESEADLEEAILEVQSELFGDRRIYLDVKKKIGARGGQRNIPDGYLIDLSGLNPRLYVVENELASHDPLRHIAVQLLQFSLSFEDTPGLVREILFGALTATESARAPCERFIASSKGTRNLDHLVETLVQAPFTALVIVDEIPDNLERVLVERFKFGVETLTLERYTDESGERAYVFERFLENLIPGDGSNQDAELVTPVDLSAVDTIVVPARETGFQETFLGEDRWYAIRIHGSMRSQIKHIAAYQTAPTSAITHVASVASIEPYGDTGKVVVNFEGAAEELGPIQLVQQGSATALQNIRYTTIERLRAAETLNDLW